MLPFFRVGGAATDEPGPEELDAVVRGELGLDQVPSRANARLKAQDLLTILPYDAPEEALDPVRIWEVRRRSGLHADLLVVTRSEFFDAQDSVTTLSAIVAREGVMLFPERVTFR